MAENSSSDVVAKTSPSGFVSFRIFSRAKHSSSGTSK
jgi:hypothetical protein